MEKSILFQPLELKHIVLPGRIVRSATELFASEPDGHAPACEFAVYDKLGGEPLGMILTAHTCVSPEGRANLRQNAVWDDGYFSDAVRIRKGAGRNGIPVVMQIGHGGMKAERHNGGLPVFTPDNMTEENIFSVVRAFGDAALRAKRAGMDGVMLHGAHLYLLSQFFYTKFNHRTDRWGGSALNRFRIIRACLDEVKKTCGEAYPVFFKINGTDEGNTEEYFRDLVEALRSAEDGFDAVEISGWNSAPLGVPEKPYFLDTVRRLKDELSVPLIEVGGFRSTEGMLMAIEAGASAVSLSRPFLCEPDFASKVRDSDNAVSKCRGCGFCFGPLNTETQVRCPIAGALEEPAED